MQTRINRENVKVEKLPPVLIEERHYIRPAGRIAVGDGNSRIRPCPTLDEQEFRLQ